MDALDPAAGGFPPGRLYRRALDGKSRTGALVIAVGEPVAAAAGGAEPPAA